MQPSIETARTSLLLLHPGICAVEERSRRNSPASGIPRHRARIYRGSARDEATRGELVSRFRKRCAEVFDVTVDRKMGRINYQADGENLVTQLIDRGEKARSHQALCGSTGLHLHGLARPRRHNI